MSFRSFSHRSQTQRKTGRASHRHAIRRPRFETFEDRRLLSFTPAASYDVGTYPQAVAAADFDGDGHLDLVTANAGNNTVSLLLGNEGGTFQPAQTSATGAGPRSVAVGDFNADGTLDLATANAADVSILLGNGNGTFDAPTNINIGSEPASVAVGDFNDDGKLDLGVTANTYYYYGYYYGGYYGGYNGTANVLLGIGDGSMSAPITSFLNWGWHTSALVADFNGDGNQDFAAANADYWAVSVLLGDGTGGLSGGGSFPTGTSPSSVAAADVNGDLAIDLVTANYYWNSVSVLFGNGAGAFATAQNYAVSGLPTSVVLGDFNNDTMLDIATANLDGSSVSLLRGRDDGLFWNAENFPAGAGAYAVAAGDFNGDGWLDAATADLSGNTASVLINDQSWPTPPPPSVSVGDSTITEGNTGSVNATFTLTLSHASGLDVTVHYDTADGSASAGGDYTEKSGTVTIPAGQTSGTFMVAVLGDRLGEPTETFAVNLGAPTNATIGDGQGIGTILDDEPRISINNVTTTEGNGNKSKLFTFTVSLSAAYDQAVTVNYATANGTATAGSDYQSKSGVVTFAPGETSKTITVAVMEDRQNEANETFFVNLSGAIGGVIADSQGLGTILNDDSGGRKNTLSLSAVAVDAAIEDWMFPGRKKRAG